MLCCAIILQIKDELKRYFPANTEFDQWKTFLYQQTQIVKCEHCLFVQKYIKQ